MNIKGLLLLLLCGTISANIPKEPNVVIVFVIDQFPFYYLTRHQHNFKHRGFNRFIKEGVFYTKAYHAHGVPETTPGHASLSSGVLPAQHGATSNRWFKDNKTIEFGTDTDKKAAQINAPATATGYSPHHLNVDTISDQMGIHQATKHVYKAYSVSIKPRSAIATAGQRIPAFWFNDFQGGFTSSRHYMRELPDWVKNFNTQSGIRKLKKTSWPLCFDRNHDAYDYPLINNYDFAALPYRLAGNTDILIDRSSEDPYVNFLRTPAANQLLLDFATTCLKQSYKKAPNEKVLLWVCLSPLDLVGHMYGPDSLEVIDFVHHIDKQLDTCMTNIEASLGEQNVAFVLTSDHGVQSMQEISQLRGIKEARRIIANDLMKKINDRIEQEFGVSGFLGKFESTYFVYDESAAEELESAGLLESAERMTKAMLKAEPGIKQAWTFDELKQIPCEPFSQEQFYKNHLIHGRLGNIIVQPKPYCLLTNYSTGCSHSTPYEYDTHVPLGFYQKGVAAKKIRKSVLAAQLAPTIAQMLNIPAPSASLIDPLPHMLVQE